MMSPSSSSSLLSSRSPMSPSSSSSSTSSRSPVVLGRRFLGRPPPSVRSFSPPLRLVPRGQAGMDARVALYYATSSASSSSSLGRPPSVRSFATEQRSSPSSSSSSKSSSSESRSPSPASSWVTGGLRRPGGRLLRAAAFGHAAGLGPIFRIALGVALGVLESDGLRPAALGGRLRPVEAKEEFLRRCGTRQRACGAVITPVRSEGRVDEGRGRGRHDDILLDLARSRRLLDEKVRSQGVLFCGFRKVPLSSRRRGLRCYAAGSSFVIAPPLPSSLRRRRFCICCCAAAAFLVVLLLFSSSRCRSLHRRAAAPFIVAPPVLPSSSRCCCLHRCAAGSK